MNEDALELLAEEVLYSDQFTDQLNALSLEDALTFYEFLESKVAGCIEGIKCDMQRDPS